MLAVYFRIRSNFKTMSAITAQPNNPIYPTAVGGGGLSEVVPASPTHLKPAKADRFTKQSKQAELLEGESQFQSKVSHWVYGLSGLLLLGAFCLVVFRWELWKKKAMQSDSKANSNELDIMTFVIDEFLEGG